MAAIGSITSHSAGKAGEDDGATSSDAAAEVNTEVGDWAIFHPGELVATFLLPCPDPLPLADGQVVPTYSRLEYASIRLVEHVIADCYLRNLDGADIVSAAGLRPTGPSAPDDGSSEEVANWSNKHVLRASIQFHQTTSDARLRLGLEPALQLAGVVNREHLSASQRERAIRRAAATQTSAWSPDELSDAGFGSVTVAECYVGLRIVGEFPDLDELLRHEYSDEPAFGPSESDRVYPDEPSMWQWRTFAAGRTVPPDLVERRLRMALDVALGELRSIQRATHALRRVPSSLSTLQRLPFVIPAVVRIAGAVGDPRATSWTGLVATRPDLAPELAPHPLDDRSMVALARTRQRLENGPFSAHLDVHREAHVALERSGDYRLAALLLGISAESLLDELILHLMWEEAKTPEEGVQAWRDGLSRRVRSEFQGRIGGSWDVTRPNPVGAWARDVAALRHRVAHAAYTPTADEAFASFDALNALVTFVCDRLARPEILRRYPRTALALVGEGGLDRRGAYTERIQQLELDPAEPPWIETFTRWREAWRRLRQDQDGPRHADFDQAHLLVVRHPDRSVHWVKHARALHLAAEVAIVDSDEVAARIVSRLHLLADVAQQPSPDDDDRRLILPVSMAVETRVEVVRSPDLRWIEDYHLVPLTAVMVDGSDFTAPVGSGLDV